MVQDAQEFSVTIRITEKELRRLYRHVERAIMMDSAEFKSMGIEDQIAARVLKAAQVRYAWVEEEK
jgi:hypothetical protein